MENSNLNIYIYSNNNEIINILSKKYDLNQLYNNINDINDIIFKKTSILIITENNENNENNKNNENLFKIANKFKIIVFTNIFKYIDSMDYIYYTNIIELKNYLKILKNNLNKTFGIIVPIHNSYKYLDKCIHSILNQTFQNYKIYLCDDYSNDDDNYYKFKSKYSNIKNIFISRNSKNIGKFLTINLILDKINTDYFLILDSDDKLNKNRLFYDLINLNNPYNNNIYCVQSKYIRFDKDKINIIENDYGHNSITFKFDIIKLVGYYCPNRFGSDTEYIMRIKKIIGNNTILKYDKITYIAITRSDNSNLTKIYDTNIRKIFIDKVINIYKNITNPEKFFNFNTDYFVDLVNNVKCNDLVFEDYKKFYLDLVDFSNDELLKHWKEKGNIEGRLPNKSIFNFYYPNFNWKLYHINNKTKFLNDMYKVYGWIFLKNKKIYINWLKNNNFDVNIDISYSNIDISNNLDIKYDFKDFKNFILDNKIKYINVSKALKHFESRICNKFDLIKYNKLCDKFENVLFFGLYSQNDYIKLTNHNGKKYLMWGGTDTNLKFDFRKNILNKIKNYYDIINLSISTDIYNSLKKHGIFSISIYLNMVNNDIFKPLEKLGKSIYIYNGFTKGNEEIYGKSIYQEVIEKIPEYEYIFSNNLNIQYSQMPKIYSKCFIGIRLTEHDGNANTVQEFNAMNIPIIFNGKGGIKWNNSNDIINIIKTHTNNST
jgi:glycosyltransferase involved in cell wall biosynthesis